MEAILYQLLSSDWTNVILVAQTGVLLGSAVFVLLQIRHIRRDLRLRASYEYHARVLDLNRTLVNAPPEITSDLPAESWGQSPRDHLFFYILNLFELSYDIYSEGKDIMSNENWEANKTWFKETMKSEAFEKFWVEKRVIGMYPKGSVKEMNDALDSALDEKRKLGPQ